MKKMLAAVMAAAFMVCSLPVATAYADAELDQPVTDIVVEEYAYTSKVSSTLRFSGSTAYCTSIVEGKPGVTRIEATQKLQKKVLWWWSDVATWSDSVNGRYLEMNNQKTVTESGTYRVRVDAVVYSGSESETVDAESPEVTK